MIRFYITLFLAITVLPQAVSAQCIKTSLYFDGVVNAESTLNDHVDISTYGPMSTIESGASYTIEAWVKRARINNPGGYERIISKDLTYQFRIINNQFVGQIGSSSIQTPYPSDNKWHHLAFVRNATNGTLNLYIDGQLSATAADNSTSIPNNGAMVCIGARNDSSGTIDELWKGNIRWLRVSKKARYLSNFTPTDIYIRDDQTLALWAFDVGSGNSLYDPAGYHNGTIINATWATETETPPLSPSLSAQSTYVCAGLSTRITASNCSGRLEWGTGESGNFITVKPYATTTYAVRCVSASGCASNAAELTINVEGVMPTISIVATPGTFIQKGEVVTFTATSTHGGLTPVYQWRKNGAVVGTNSPSYTDSQLNSGDSIRCLLTSNAPCRQLDKVISKEVKILIPELTANGTCGENSLALNNLPYTEIRWKKNGQYIDNSLPGNRGNGVTVAGNPGDIILNEGSVFVDEANAFYVPSNRGIVKVEADGKEMIVVPSTKSLFFRSRSGTFYIAHEDRIEKWQPGDTVGTLVAGGNGFGSNANQFSSNFSRIQVTESGSIFIADVGNNRIQRWEPGASEGVSVAQGLEVSFLFYVDRGGNLFTGSEGVIYKWLANTSTPTPLYSYQNLESGGIATAISGDGRGNLFIPIYNTSGYNTHVYRFNSNGAVKLFSMGGFSSYYSSAVLGLAVSTNSELYLSSQEGGGCCGGVFKWNSGTSPQRIRGKYITNETNMVSPNDVFVDGKGDIYTWNNELVQKWSLGSKIGATVAGGNGVGSASNQLDYATDVVVDKDGNVYVSDKNNHRVQRWSQGSSSGVTVAGGNGQGTAANQLALPGKIFVDNNKTLFIADNNRIQKWSNNSLNGLTVLNSTSSYVFVKEDTIFAAGIKLGPGVSVGISHCGPTNVSYNDLHMDNQKRFVLSFYGAYRTTVYNSLISRWSPTTGPSGNCIQGKIDTLTQSVYTPTGIFIDSLNNLYVADTQRKKIQKFLSTSPTLTDTSGGTYTAEVTIGSRTLSLNATPGGNNSGLCESTGSGNWSNSALWTCGRVPLACDQVVIDAGHTVTLAESVQISGLEVRQNGTLSLAGGNVQIAKP